jgi:hypothetical protein
LGNLDRIALMSTILQADETGALRVPASLLPHSAPHRRYRVTSEKGQLIVDEMPGSGTKPWMELAGCMKGEGNELRRIDEVIEGEFEQINTEDWR